MDSQGIACASCQDYPFKVVSEILVMELMEKVEVGQRSTALKEPTSRTTRNFERGLRGRGLRKVERAGAVPDSGTSLLGRYLKSCEFGPRSAFRFDSRCQVLWNTKNNKKAIAWLAFTHNPIGRQLPVWF